MLAVLDARVRFGATAALDGVSLSVADGEVVAVLGPSGSGKTTLLRAVAGLQALDSGSITWDGADLTPVPPHRREFGLMFQDYALFPHLDVGRNVEFGLRMQGLPATERAHRAAAVLGRVELGGFERRKLATLSGGQAQRVALARALAPGPRMLLLDEPLGSLDRALRERLTGELHDMLRDLEITALYVTHDRDEAFALADRVAVLDAGAILQIGTPEDLWRRPRTERLARFLGLANILAGEIRGGWAGTTLGPVPVPAGTPDGPAGLVIRPRAFRADPRGPLEATVISRLFRGGGYLAGLDIGSITVEAYLRHCPAVGSGLRLSIDPDEVSVLG
jgi:thiamine transport system ATP-binding protein